MGHSILVAAGHEATRWTVRGIALGGMTSFLRHDVHSNSIVIFFVTFLHGFTPRIGVYVMNVSDESYCLHDHVHDICF